MEFSTLNILLAVFFAGLTCSTYPEPIEKVRGSWNLAMISARVKLYIESMWGYEFERIANPGKGVDIYIMEESSLQTELTEFENRASYFIRTGTELDTEHATCTASIAAGKIFGVASKANILMVQIDHMGDLVSGIHKIIEQHNYKKKHHEQFPEWRGSIISASFGCGEDDVYGTGPWLWDIDWKLIEATKMADEAGVVIIGCAGNADADVTKHKPFKMPCMSPGVLCVGGVNRFYDRAEDSNYGLPIQIWAPSHEVMCQHSSEGKCVSVSGTSFAGPHVAGIVATMLGYGQPYDRALVDNTFNIKLTLLGNAVSGLLGRGLTLFEDNRKLLANTGIQNRQPPKPFKDIEFEGLHGAFDDERHGDFFEVPRPFGNMETSGANASCSSPDSGEMISLLDARKLWLRLRWELGHVNMYNGSTGGYQKVVPCIGNACVYLNSTQRFEDLWRFSNNRVYLEKYVHHLMIRCVRRIGSELMTGGSIEVRHKPHLNVVLRRNVSPPP